MVLLPPSGLSPLAVLPEPFCSYLSSPLARLCTSFLLVRHKLAHHESNSTSSYHISPLPPNLRRTRNPASHPARHTVDTPLLPSARRHRQQLNQFGYSKHIPPQRDSRCATSWSSFTRPAAASTTSTRLTGVRHTAGQGMASRGRRYWLDTPAATTHHTLRDTTTQHTRHNTRTRGTTRGGQPRAPRATTDDAYCLR